MTNYDLMHIITNIMYVYMIYILFNNFLGEEVYSNKIKNISYLIFFILSSLIVFVTRIPIVMFLFNAIFLFQLSLNYKVQFQQRIVSIFLVYSIGIMIEVFISYFFNYKDINILNNSEFNSIIGLVLIRIMGVVVAYLITRYRVAMNKTFEIPKTYYFIFVFMSLGTMYLYINSLVDGHLELLNIIISSMILVGINILMIFLDGKIYKSIILEQEKELLNQQNIIYENQNSIITQSNEMIRILNHDMKNHIYAIMKMNSQGKRDEIEEYTKGMIDQIDNGGICKSYNFVIDSIVNFKLIELVDKNIKMKIDVCIPHTLDILANDLIAILGNLLDNAVTAVLQSEEKVLELKMSYEIGNLIVILKNSYDGKLKIENKIFKTTKSFKAGHGIGLKSVKIAVKKYQGDLELEHTPNYFIARVILPVEK